MSPNRLPQPRRFATAEHRRAAAAWGRSGRWSEPRQKGCRLPATIIVSGFGDGKVALSPSVHQGGRIAQSLARNRNCAWHRSRKSELRQQQIERSDYIRLTAKIDLNKLGPAPIGSPGRPSPIRIRAATSPRPPDRLASVRTMRRADRGRPAPWQHPSPYRQAGASHNSRLRAVASAIRRPP